MKESELRIGNLVNGNDTVVAINWDYKTGHSVEIMDFIGGTMNVTIDRINPIPLTEEWLLKLGFEPIPHMTVMNPFTLDIGRDRVISIGCVGTPNEMIFLIEDYSKRAPSQDICVLRNFDYDGRTYVHTLQNIVHSLTGKELVYNA